ncbi:MAG: Spy/CpxP family protein refolding chaperone [Nitrospinaceae bacterium]|nr:Spy/CpxP family protein refolding chaperone [Nitrospinaceae bacterium]
MFNLKIRHLIALTATATLFFSQNALAATAMDSIGTGSAGSYSHGEAKGEGSKSKTMPHHISGSENHHISGSAGHHKPEGSGSKKSYSHHGEKGYSHNKLEGSKHQAGSGHGYSKSSHGDHGGHTSKCPFTHLLRFKDKLGLTEAQVAEIKRLRFEYGKKSIRNKAEHKIAHMEFDKQVHAEKLDVNAIRLAAGKIARTKTEKIMDLANAKIALLTLLTEEQRKIAHAMHSAH